MLNQKRDIVLASAQGWKLDLYHAQAVIEVGAELARLHELPQLAVAGGDQANVDFDHLVAAQATHFLFLDGAQQLHLQRGAHLRNFVEEYRTAARFFQDPPLVFDSSGESAADVAEELGFEQCFSQGTAVQGEEALVGPGTVVVDGLGHQLFARATFAVDQHRGAGVCHHGDRLIDFHHRTAASYQAGELNMAAKLPFEVEVLLDQVAVVQCSLHLQNDFINLEGFRDVVKGPGLCRFNGVFERPEGRDEDNLGLRMTRLVGSQHIQAVELGAQIQVTDDEVERFSLADGERLLTAARSHHPAALFAQYLAKQILRGGIVVNHENVGTRPDCPGRDSGGALFGRSQS